MAYEPLPRWGHFSSFVEGKLFMFGGRIEDFHNHRDELKRTIKDFDVFHETWSSFHAGGSPPLGIYGGASTSLSNNIYYYGGTYSGTDYQGSLHKWDSSTMSWNQLKEHENKGPIKKGACAMISHNEEIVLFGGRGIPTGPIQQGSKFIVSKKFTDGSGWTNELHSFNLQEGTWSSPTVTGTRPPPCSDFTLTKINENTAVMFGGFLPGFKRTNDVYILDLTKMHWSKLVHKEGQPCPVARSDHASVCLGYGGDYPELLITGGVDDNGKVISDMWILNLQSKKWREIKVPNLQSRCYHTADVFHFSARLAEVILFGGVPVYPKNPKSDADLPMIAQTTVLRFECVDDEWTLIDVCKFPDLGSPERVKMKEELKQQFKLQSLTGDWVLTDVVNNSQQGTSESIREKMVYMSQVVRDQEERVREAERRVSAEAERRQAAEQQAREAERRVSEESNQRAREAERRQAAEQQASEAERRVSAEAERRQAAEQQAREAERRVSAEAERRQAAEQQAREAERRIVEIERRAEGRCTEAERRAHEAEGRLQTSEERAMEADRRAQRAEQHAREAESRGDERHWLVQRKEIDIKEESLGGGGWGEVKVARFRGVKVAAKMLYKSIRTGYYQSLFIREMNMASKIRHPNLVLFIGACMDEGMVILMELMPTSLRREMEREDFNMSAHQLTSISLDVARALNYLHLIQPDPIVHRDISSANVLLEPLPSGRWRAKVTDYGSVNFQQQLQTVGPGSPVYAAPEAHHPSLQSPKMDIFSFGVLLVEMCTWQFPEVSAHERLIASIQDQHWVDLIRRCIRQDKDNRPSAAELLDNIQAFE